MTYEIDRLQYDLKQDRVNVVFSDGATAAHVNVLIPLATGSAPRDEGVAALEARIREAVRAHLQAALAAL